MESAPQDLLVVTDLSGTLLDRHTNSSAAAQPALQRLAQLGVPVVFNSSKTAADILALRSRLDNEYPFISENGADLYVPQAPHADEFTVRRFGMTRNHILHQLAEVGADHDFSYLAFSTLTPEQQLQLSGLGRNILQLLMQRLYTESLLWRDSAAALQAFMHSLRERGLRVQVSRQLRRGRLLHVKAPVDKATPLPALREWFREMRGMEPRVLALGAGTHDVPLLEAADLAVQIPAPGRPHDALRNPCVLRSKAEGPAGWNHSVLQLLDKLASLHPGAECAACRKPDAAADDVSDTPVTPGSALQ